MKKKITIEYHWLNNEGTDIPVKHQEALEESAQERINQMMSEGYTSGELHDNISMDDEDGEDGVSYSGWFSVSTETV